MPAFLIINKRIGPFHQYQKCRKKNTYVCGRYKSGIYMTHFLIFRTLHLWLLKTMFLLKKISNYWFWLRKKLKVSYFLFSHVCFLPLSLSIKKFFFKVWLLTYFKGHDLALTIFVEKWRKGKCYVWIRLCQFNVMLLGPSCLI